MSEVVIEVAGIAVAMPLPWPSAAKRPIMPADVILHAPTVSFEDDVSEAVEADPNEVVDLKAAAAAAAAAFK
jgi:hypothetical protein